MNKFLELDNGKIVESKNSYHKDDILKIEKIERTYFVDSWNIKQINSQFKNEDSLNFIIENTGDIISYCLCKFNDEFIEILKIATIRNYQKKGMASNLISNVYSFAVKNSLKKIYLEVRESNLIAIDLYKKKGFVVDGIRKKYYVRSNENAILMSKNINYP